MYKAIHYINKKGIYHLDIKPENFLIKKINEEFVFKVIDFGHTYTEQNNSVSFQYFYYYLDFRLTKQQIYCFILYTNRFSKNCSEKK